MALPNLATTSDLSDRGVTVTDVHATMLRVASSLVREAAGSPILEANAIISWWAIDSANEWLTIPATPIRSVSSVTLDGRPVDNYKLVHGDLWRRCGWSWGEPLEVEADVVIGLPEVPEHIKQLVCDLAILGTNTATSGAMDPRVVMESIDDYSVQFSQSGGAVASAMTIPKATRVALRRQFGRGFAAMSIR